eukprot:SAG22_NODE_8333_length_663_cov_1.498227_2_plen_38_part_01
MASSWSSTVEVANWLRRDVGLPEYCEQFVDSGVTGDRL